MPRGKDWKLWERKQFLKEWGEIYVIKCLISGKYYIGQCQLLTGEKLKPHGTFKRWGGHISDSKKEGGGTCALLNAAIRKYKPNNFEVTQILTCKLKDLSKWEDFFMIQYNSLVPNGYNLREAGRCGRASAETCRKISESNSGPKHHQYGKPQTEEVREKIRQTNINNAIRFDYDGITRLPKYFKYFKHEKIEGYMIVSHPLCAEKRFGLTQKERRLPVIREKALAHLAELNAKLPAKNKSSKTI